MGREIRMVPKDWQHPKDDNGQYKPLHNYSFKQCHAEWVEGFMQWQKGYRMHGNDGWIPIEDEYKHLTFSEWDGDEPKSDEYMPDFKPEEATFLMMYENTSEGTPISPALACQRSSRPASPTAISISRIASLPCRAASRL